MTIFEKLRKQAENILERRRGPATDASDLASVELLHELEVNFIELELQNEALLEAKKDIEISRNEYYTLFDTAPIGFVTLDAKGFITRINQAAREILEDTTDILIGKLFSSRIHSDDSSRYYELLSHMTQNNTAGTCELRLNQENSRLKTFVRMEGRGAWSVDGEFTGWHFSLSDITRRKKAETALKRSRADLESKVKERTRELEIKNLELQDFASIASHDLREPLRKVRTFGDMVVNRSWDLLDDQSRDYLSRMILATERMQGLLDSLMVYSRVTTQAVEKKEINLNESVSAAISNLELLIHENNARIEVGELPRITADFAQMIQIFQNLIANALRFRKKDTAPVIKIYSQESPHEDTAFEIHVKDNGIGMDPQHTDKIFRPFQRLGDKKDYEGTGMGLTICKKIMDRHGFLIDATSSPKKGATFILKFPFPPPSA